MKLLTLELRQWRSFDECDLEFPDGLIGVRGPNGAGKTTLAEAIGWALFGKARPGTKVADLKRQGAPKGARSLVRLSFRLGPTIYRVERVVGGHAKLWIGDGDEPETSQTTATNQRIARELGVTWETFQRTVFARQKDVAALDPGGSAEARKKHVERLLGLGRYRVAAEKAKARARELGQQRDALREQAPDLEALRAELAEAERAAASADPGVTAAAQARAEAAEARTTTEAAVEAERARVERHARLSEDAARLEREIAELRGDLETKRERLAERTAHEATLASLDGRDDDLEALAGLRRGWERLDACARDLAGVAAPEAIDAEAAAARVRQLGELDAELERLVAADVPDPAALQRRLAALEQAAAAPSLSEALTRLADLNAERDEIQGRRHALTLSVEEDEAHVAAIEEGGADVACPTCLRPYGEDFEEILRAHGARLAQHRSHAAALAERWDELEAQRAAAEDSARRAERAAAMLESTAGVDDVEEARSALALAEQLADGRRRRLDELRARRVELKGLVAEDQERQVRAADAMARLALAEERLQEAAAAVGVAGFDPTLRDEAVRAHEAAVATRETRQKLTATLGATSGLAAEVATLTKRLEQRVAQASEAAGEVAALGLDADELERLRAAAQIACDDYERVTEAVQQAKLQAQERSQRVQELRLRLRDAEEAHRVLAERTHQARLHTVAGDLLGEYRSAQHQRAWPKLDEGASRLLAETTDGRYADVRLSDDYKLVIVDRGEAHGLERFSGGEQDLANLCLRLAIADWVSREGDAEMGFVVLDEVFGSQDEDRRKRLLGELRALGNRFHQVLVITHVSDIADLCDNQLQVELAAAGTSRAVITS